MTVWEWRSGVTKRLYLLARLLSSFATRPKGVNPYEFTPRREHPHVGSHPLRFVHEVTRSDVGQLGFGNCDVVLAHRL